MFQLNENSMKRIMREEYMKRLKKFLAEEIDIEYKIKGSNETINLINNARGLKVIHEPTGYEYTIHDYDEAAQQVILLAPDVPRLDTKLKSTSKLIEADIDNDGIPDELDDDIQIMKSSLSNDPIEKEKRKTTSDKLNLINYNQNETLKGTPDISKKDYIIVPVDQFIKDYSL